MDAFKLLSRSTTLSSKRAGKPQSSHHERLPSKQHIAGRNPATQQQSQKKRKRASDAEIPQHNINIDIDAETDFFRDSQVSSKDTTQAAVNLVSDHENRAQDELTSLSDSEDGLVTDFLPMPEEECRRILESHKIKITQIWPTDDDMAGQASSRTKKQKRQALAQIHDNDDDYSNKDRKKKKKKRLDVVPQPLTSFAHMRRRWNIHPQLSHNLAVQGYTTPTEIQLSALPLLLDGINGSNTDIPIPPADAAAAPNTPAVDLLAVAPTGSGKTLAFLIPVINFIARQKAQALELHDASVQSKPKGPTAIVVAPTKELAAQIVIEARNLAIGIGISVSRPRKNMAFSSNTQLSSAQDQPGEVDDSSDSEAEHDNENEELVKPQSTRRSARAPDILVCAPLSLVKAITTDAGAVQPLDTVKCLILDEADVLLDKMFRAQTLKLWSACTSPDLHVSLWSATMGSSVEALAASTITSRHIPVNPTKRTPQRTTTATPTPLLRLVIGLKDSAIPASINHKLTYCGNEAGKLLALRQLLRSPPRSSPSETPLHPPFLVFTQTIPRAIALASELKYDIPPPPTTTADPTAASPNHARGARRKGAAAHPPSRVAVLHADLSPAARTATMSHFRRGAIWLLITTDLLARGVDFPAVNAVLNYDFPNSAAAYVHRVGRTGRTVRTRSASSAALGKEEEEEEGEGGTETRRAGTAITFVAEEDVPFLRNVVNVIEGAERAAAAARAGDAAAGESELPRTPGGGGASAVKEWMREALPKPSKRQRQELKRRGVEARRTPLGKKGPAARAGGGGGEGRRGGFQTRISTKSGYERRLERRRREAVRANQRKGKGGAGGADGGS